MFIAVVLESLTGLESGVKSTFDGTRTRLVHSDVPPWYQVGISAHWERVGETSRKSGNDRSQSAAVFKLNGVNTVVFWFLLLAP